MVTKGDSGGFLKLGVPSWGSPKLGLYYSGVYIGVPSFWETTILGEFKKRACYCRPSGQVFSAKMARHQTPQKCRTAFDPPNVLRFDMSDIVPVGKEVRLACPLCAFRKTGLSCVNIP